LENKPVYPRPNPEYEKTMREQFLHRMKNMRWDDPEECYCKPRGRKPKQIKLPEKVKPRFKSGYNWFD
jgi:hypothetical protein